MSEEKYKEMTLRERFESKCLAVVKYARANNLTQSTLSDVLNKNAEVSGMGRSKTGMVRKIYTQLKEDGIWIGALPWED